MRTALGYVCELIGFACLVAAAYRVSLTWALVVLGLGFIIGAQAGDRRAS